MSGEDVTIRELVFLEDQDSPKAYRVEDKHGKRHWLPKSQITRSKQRLPTGQVVGSATMPLWLAESKGLY